MERTVTNEQFLKALNNTDYKKLINSVIRKYKKVLDKDTLQSCAWVGLWKSMCNHDEKYNTPFTSSLFYHVKWECQYHCKKEAKQRPICTGLDLIVPCKNNDIKELEDSEHFNFCLNKISPEYHDIIKTYLFSKNKLKKIAKDKKINYRRLLKISKLLVRQLAEYYYDD